MVLLEIAAQGVRGVSPAGGRVTLRPGYNTVAADPAALRLLVEALLLPDGTEGDAFRAASPGVSRAGLTLVGDDGATYRVVRDFAGGGQLQRLDPQRRSFAVLSQDRAEMARILHAAGVPSRSRLDALLSIRAAELPSRHTAVAAQAPPTARRAAPEEAKRRIAALRDELVRAKAAEKLQYQVDGLQTRLFKLEEALKAGARLREEADAAEQALGGLAAAAAVLRRLGDVGARLAALDKSNAKRDEGLARVAEERAALDERAAGGAAPPFWRTPLFIAGAAIGVAAAGVGAAGAAIGSVGLRYLALLDIPSFGLAGWVALRWIGGLEELEGSERRRRLVDEHERKVLEQHEREMAEVRAAVAELKLGAPRELEELRARIAAAEAAAAEARQRLADWESQPDARAAREEKGKVAEALRRAETQLAQQAGGFVRDPRSVEAEIARAESEMASPASPATAPRSRGGEPLRTLVEGAAAELGTPAAEAVRAVGPRAAQLLAALSGQRLGALAADDGGALRVESGGRTVAAVSLAPVDRDLCWLALKLAWLERALADDTALALADDAFAGLPEGARRTVARFLKQIARAGQLVHGTVDPCFREAADHAA